MSWEVGCGLEVVGPPSCLWVRCPPPPGPTHTRLESAAVQPGKVSRLPPPMSAPDPSSFPFLVGEDRS